MVGEREFGRDCERGFFKMKGTRARRFTASWEDKEENSEQLLSSAPPCFCSYGELRLLFLLVQDQKDLLNFSLRVMHVSALGSARRPLRVST